MWNLVGQISFFVLLQCCYHFRIHGEGMRRVGWSRLDLILAFHPTAKGQLINFKQYVYVYIYTLCGSAMFVRCARAL